MEVVADLAAIASNPSVRRPTLQTPQTQDAMAKKKNKPKAAKPDWLEFEQAVARLIKAIGGNAKVTHNAILPDEHTGKGRQRDVWIEWLVAEHFPSKALISCKYWANPLDQGDIDHFNGEFISSGAQLGIIYARNGFYADALEKAKVLGFHCCKLYRDQQADLPAALIFDVYHLRPAFTVSVDGQQASRHFEYWKELFSLKVGDSTVLEKLAQRAEEFQSVFKSADGWQKIKAGYIDTFRAERDGLSPFEIVVQ